MVRSETTRRVRASKTQVLPGLIRLTHSSVTEDLYREMSTIAKQKGIPITMHCAEVRADRAFHESVSTTPTSYCDNVGLLGPQTVLVHMVHLDDEDVQRLADTGTHVAHCPTSNCKLASGICRVPALQKAGVNIGLGTDGAPCNNTNDMFQEMKLAGILHKAVTLDPTAVPAEDVLEMATINGARALGLEQEIGSLVVGKKADFVAIKTNSIGMRPYYSPVSAVVYSATGHDVDMVVVDGKILVQDGKLLSMDETSIWESADKLGHEVVKRAGKTKEVSGRWPML
jgi:cytosine/adenosine deaminase-related metal-dependent hydrolase